MTLKKFLAFVLCFFIGFATCAGAIVGAGYWAYTRVSLNKLNDMGVVKVDPDAIRDPDAEVDLASLTLKGLFAELERLSKLETAVTIDTLVNRYQLKLPESVARLLPEGLRNAPLTKLVSSEGVDYILENTDIDYLYQFLPSDVLGEPAREALSGKTLAEVVDMDMQNLLKGVKLGYVTGVKYEKGEDGEYLPVYADPEKPTLMELIGSIDLADALDVFANGGDMMTVVSEHMEDVMVDQLLGSMTDLSQFPLQGVFEGLTLGDVLVYDENADAYVFDLGKAVRGKTFAELLEYTAVMDESGSFVETWLDKEGEPVYGIFRGMAETPLDALGEKEINLMDLMVDVYIGDVMEYRPVFDEAGEIVEWKTSDGETVGGLNAKIANMTMGQFTAPDFTFAKVLEDVYVGDLMDYTAVKDDLADPDKVTGWIDNKTNEPLSGMDLAMANIDLGKLMQGGDDYKIEDALGDLYLGELLKYTLVKDENGNIVKDEKGYICWKDGEKDVSPLYARIASLTVGEMMADGLDFSTVFNGLHLGEALGYTSEPEDGKTVWYEEKDGEKVKVEGVDGAIANIDLGQLLGENEYDVLTVFDDLLIGEAMSYKKGDPVKEDDSETADEDEIEYEWWKKDAAGEYTVKVTGVEAKLSNYKLGDLLNGKVELNASEMTEGMTVAEVLGYTQDKDGNWTSDGNKVTGVMAAIADLHIDTLSDEIKTVQIGKLMNYTHKGEDTPDETDDHWEDANGDPADAVTAAFADMTVGELENSGAVGDKFKELQVGTILGYTKDPITGKWMDDGKEADGIMVSLADLKIEELDESGKVTTAIQTVKVGEAMGYKEGDDPETPEKDNKWWKLNEETGEYDDEVTGVMAVIAGKTIGDLGSENGGINEMMIGELLGYTPDKDGDGKIVGWFDENEKAVGGVIAAIAHLKIDQLGGNGSALTDAVKTVKVGEAMGYTQDKDGSWTSGGKKVTGVMGALADKEIGDLDSATEGIGAMSIGKLLGYSEDPENGDWIDENEKPVGGVIAAIAHLTINQLGSDDTTDLTDAIKTVKVGDAMGYTQDPDSGEWMNGTAPVTGFMATISGKQISELDSLTSTVTVGELMGYTPVYDESLPEADRIPEKASGWTDGGKTVTGVMAAISSAKIDNLQDKINDTPIGKLLSYDKRAANSNGVTWHDGTDYVSLFINKICDSRLEDLGTTMSNLKVADIFTLEERNSGFLKLIDGSTSLTSLGSEITETFENVTVGELVDAGVVNFDPSTINTLTLIDEYHWEEYERKQLEEDPENFKYIEFDDWVLVPGNSWKTKTIGGFINSLGDLGDIVSEKLTGGSGFLPGGGSGN